jgi:hypothetical protein
MVVVESLMIRPSCVESAYCRRSPNAKPLPVFHRTRASRSLLFVAAGGGIGRNCDDDQDAIWCAKVYVNGHDVEVFRDADWSRGVTPDAVIGPNGTETRRTS